MWLERFCKSTLTLSKSPEFADLNSSLIEAVINSTRDVMVSTTCAKCCFNSVIFAEFSDTTWFLKISSLSEILGTVSFSCFNTSTLVPSCAFSKFSFRDTMEELISFVTSPIILDSCLMASDDFKVSTQSKIFCSGSSKAFAVFSPPKSASREQILFETSLSSFFKSSTAFTRCCFPDSSCLWMVSSILPIWLWIKSWLSSIVSELLFTILFANSSKFAFDERLTSTFFKF